MGKATENLARVTRIGLDLAKTVFQVHGGGAEGEVVIARKLRRGAMLEFFGRLAPCVVAMEACGSAHHWGRQLMALGHEVKLIPPAHVKPYVRRNKTDAADAATICEAAMRPGQRFVALRSIDNQAAVMRHRVREGGVTLTDQGAQGSDLGCTNGLRRRCRPRLSIAPRR
jgi:transposase